MKKYILFSALFLAVILIIFLYFVFKKPPVTVIVRSVGERTEQKCVENLENIFNKKNVFLIKNVTPLSKATKQSFELAIKREAKWTLLVDADTLVDKEKINIFIKKADEIIKKDEKAFVFQPLIYDKFPQSYRHSGVWLYRSDKLPNLLSYYQKCALMLKPDDCIVTSYLDNGGNSYGIDCVVGIHDFFQSPRSIVKKYFLRSIKSSDRITDWKTDWQELSKTDNDFYWALKGVEISKQCQKNKIINNSDYLDSLIDNYKLNYPQDSKLTDELIRAEIRKYVLNNSIDKDDIKTYRTRLYKRDYI